MKVYVTKIDNKEFDSMEEAILNFKMFNSEREILEAILAGENEVVIIKNCRIFATKKIEFTEREIYGAIRHCYDKIIPDYVNGLSLIKLCELLNIDRETLDF